MLGFIGGTGPEGRGLALRFALAGEAVCIGSRDEVRAHQAAEQLARLAPSASISGGRNVDVAERSDVAFIVVPYEAQRPTLEGLRRELAGKIAVDAVAPLEVSGGVARAVDVPERSAAMQAQEILAESSVAAAFQTISARDLSATNRSLDSDVIVCADDDDTRRRVMGLVERIPQLRAIDGGGLENSRYVEGFTALLLNINRRYKAHSAIRIVGL